MDALYSRVKALAASATREKIEAAEASRREVLGAVHAAQDKLMARILDNFDEKVQDAAQRGETSVTLFDFKGNDVFDDGTFFTLFLLRGPRNAERSEDVQSLMPRLRRQVAPFRVHHVWDRGTVNNRVVASWP